MSRRKIVERLRDMPVHERQVFVKVAWDRDDPDDVADLLRLPTPVVLARFTRGMRKFADAPASMTAADDAVARYLAFRGTTLQRDEIAYQLRDRGVDPLDLDELDAAMACARRSRRRGLRTVQQAGLIENVG
jgi:hypothetical protein